MTTPPLDFLDRRVTLLIEKTDFTVSADGNTVIFSSDHEVLGVRQLYQTEVGDVLFIDGFESGDTRFWSQSVP